MHVWKLIATGALSCTFLCAHHGVLAQEQPSNTESAIVKRALTLREGTEVQLKLAQDVNSRASKPNEPIELSLASDLIVDGQIVARAGSRAMGTVVHAKKPDFWGEAGEVNIRVTFLKAGTTKVLLRGAAGEVGTRYIVIRGSQAILKAGTLIKAYIAEDTKID
jgi:hypothetical protein